MAPRNGAVRKIAEQSFEDILIDKSIWARCETFRIHRLANETRVASSLSCVEIFVALYYGEILNYDPKKRFWDGRDRFVISKGHGSISMYPILADLGFFDPAELKNVCKEGSFFGGIPDPIIPGYETVNGSLGHGLGVACGMAYTLKMKKHNSQVFCLVGDGELNEGAIWEAIMFAAHHGLDNLNLIVDQNTKCMLDLTVNVVDINPLETKLQSFGLYCESVDGHDVIATQGSLKRLKDLRGGQPKVLVAKTIKGKGAPKLEASPLCHLIALNSQEIDDAIARLSR